jgi:tetratricopeptide (TPR) repeat protein
MSNRSLKGVRYQKRINIGKFLRLNISKTGIGLSIGVRGLRYTRGPSGTYLTTGIPGTGLSYRKKLNNKKGFQYASLKRLNPSNWGKDKDGEAPVQKADAMAVDKPGLFAPGWEKALFKGVEAYHEKAFETAIEHLRTAAEDDDVDLGALILLAFLLAEDESVDDREEAISLLETVVSSDDAFPTPALEQYMQGIMVDIAITPQVEVTLPIADSLAPTLLLVELYQEAGEMEQAVELLEDVDEIIAEGNENRHNQILTLSLAELYLLTKNYQTIVEQVQVPETIKNNVLLGLSFFYARALQEQNLHTAAIQVFNICLRRKKGLNPDLRQACRLWRAMSFLKTKQKSRARAELEKTLAEATDPDIKRVTMQALHFFWPHDFSAGSTGSLPKLPASSDLGK